MINEKQQFQKKCLNEKQIPIFDHENNSFKMEIKTLTHDYYMLQLPTDHNNIFYRQFPLYLDELDFRNQHIRIAPVARIYGSNEFGQKCCCHIHGYFPHFYIKADEYAESFLNNRAFVTQFLSMLEGLYQRAYSTNRPIIMNGFPQNKIDFYGFHEKQETFLKIMVYDPAYITRLRQLLDSEILNGKIFQCYQAHINYFMHLFSDNNIYGINNLTVFQFTFRKNLSHELIGLFQKMNTMTEELFEEGFNLIQIQRSHPQMFNCLQKNSCCFIQIDLPITSILNNFSPDHDIVPSEEDENSIDSEMDLQNINEPSCKVKFQVKITRALKQIWEDERKRRLSFGINKIQQGVIDYTKNIQGKNQRSMEYRDPLWVNFVKKANNLDQVIQMIRSYSIGISKKEVNLLEINLDVAQNYRQFLQLQKQNLIQKVMSRWKYYGFRKKQSLEQIMKGQRDELPEWEDDQNKDGTSSSQEEEDKMDEEHSMQMKQQNQKGRNFNNTVLYRNNYKHLKANLRIDSYFYVCNYCKKGNSNCQCKKKEDGFSYESTEDTLSNYILPMEINKDKQNSTYSRFKYDQRPPTTGQVVDSCCVKYQVPYYSNYKDLFSYHKIHLHFEPCLKNAQILQKELKVVKDYNREPISIKNQLRWPYYFRFFQARLGEEEKVFKSTSYRLKYTITPPTSQELSKQLIKGEQQKVSYRRSTSIKLSKEDTFVSDLVIFHYEFLVQFQNNSQRFCADPEKNGIISFLFQTRNFQEYRRAKKTLILVQNYVKMDKEFLNTEEYDDIFVVKNEYGLLSLLISCIFRLDPDLLVTYDQEKRGIRYLSQRGYSYGINFQSLISRVCDLDQLLEFINFKQFSTLKGSFITKQVLMKGNIFESKNKNKKTSAQINYLQQKLLRSLKKKPVLRQKYKFDLEINGRVNINLYRICQQQLKLSSYTLQHMCKYLFNEQLPQFTDNDIFQIFIDNSTKEGINFALSYINKRIEIQAQIVVNLNIISVLVEKSKIFGSDIVSMMERGSQFKIEAVMCRVTKKLGYVTLSASKRQVANQSILECIPLVLQPPKQFFPDPVLLFDFQSLYPSIMIAYNLCYSTCLGSINNLFDKEKAKKMGVSEKMNIDISFLEEIFKKTEDLQQSKKKIQNSVFITPNKVAFVKKSVRQGVLPRILLQFLISRIMIKQSESLYKKTKIKKTLKDRQYAIKIFMNVMFGYTGASFSGRMPCSEIADSIIQLSKYCLRKAMDFLNDHPKYKGKVIYGDTDSIFFQLPGYRTRQIFEIGKNLATQITEMFPYPIEMKFQKVYEGLFLVAKKRYYGKMYENQDSLPKYEGKGLECIRRDGINLTKDMMKTILDSIIDKRDLSIVKQIYKEQCAQILNNQVLQNQFTLAKQVKLLKYSDKSCPAHGQAAKRLEKIDPMMIPKYGERMKYLVINGGIKPIKNRSISVFQYLKSKSMSLDLDYYLKKQVTPPLQRVLSSLVDLNEWTLSIEYRHKFQFAQPHQLQINKKCFKCKNDTFYILCEKCLDSIQEEMIKVNYKQEQSKKICEDCTGCTSVSDKNKCVEFNCKQLWSRRAIERMKRNVYPELVRLKQAIEALNF